MKTLLDDPSISCKNVMTPDNGGIDDGCEIMTEPTPLQKRILGN
jgi:hypothetical protein